MSEGRDKVLLGLNVGGGVGLVFGVVLGLFVVGNLVLGIIVGFAIGLFGGAVVDYLRFHSR